MKSHSDTVRAQIRHFPYKGEENICPICDSALNSLKDCPQCSGLSHKCVREMLQEVFIFNNLF